MSTSSTALIVQSRGLETIVHERRPKVMVVEDEAIIALDIQLQLIKAGFAVTGRAPTAAKAFQLIEREAPDIVLMDIKLKGDMDGVAATSIIHSRYTLPVIYLTAHADEATLQRATATEPYGFLVKPFASAAMTAAITMAVHKHRMERKRQTIPTPVSTILHVLPDALIVANSTGEIVLLNRAAERDTGWSSGEAAGRKVSEIACIQDYDGRDICTSLLQQAIATGTAVRIPSNSGLIAKNGDRSEVSGKISVINVDGESASLFVALLDVTVPKRLYPAQLHKSPTVGTAEWMIVLLCLPGKEPEPSGILLLNTESDHLAVKLKTRVEFEDEGVSAFWNELAMDLGQKARERGGDQVVKWLETTASHIVQVSPRVVVDLTASSLREALDGLYHEHIEPLSVSYRQRVGLSSLWVGI